MAVINKKPKAVNLAVRTVEPSSLCYLMLSEAALATTRKSTAQVVVVAMSCCTTLSWCGWVCVCVCVCLFVAVGSASYIDRHSLSKALHPD